VTVGVSLEYTIYFLELNFLISYEDERLVLGLTYKNYTFEVFSGVNSSYLRTALGSLFVSALHRFLSLKRI